MTKQKNFGVWFLLSIILIAIVVSGIGVALDPEAFKSNIISEMVGLLISVAVGLFIVDKYIAYDRAKQWIQVRNITYKSIAAHMCEITVQALFIYNIKDNRPMHALKEGRFKPSFDNIAAIDQVIQGVRQTSSEVSAKTFMGLTVNFYDAIEWNLDQIQDVLIPRIVQSSDDQEFINILIELDSSREALYTSIISHNNYAINNENHDVEKMLNICRHVYSKLLERWKI